MCMCVVFGVRTPRTHTHMPEGRMMHGRTDGLQVLAVFEKIDKFQFRRRGPLARTTRTAWVQQLRTTLSCYSCIVTVICCAHTHMGYTGHTGLFGWAHHARQQRDCICAPRTQCDNAITRFPGVTSVRVCALAHTNAPIVRAVPSYERIVFCIFLNASAAGCCRC